MSELNQNQQPVNEMPPMPEEAYKDENLLLGIVGGVAGMLVGAIVWAIVGALGYVAAAAGLVMAVAIIWGYDKMHGKQGAIKIVIAALLVILGVVIGTAGVVAWDIHKLYADTVASLKLGEYMIMTEWEAIQSVLVDPEVWSEMIPDLLQGIFFAALGAAGTIANANKKQKKMKA